MFVNLISEKMAPVSLWVPWYQETKNKTKKLQFSNWTIIVIKFRNILSYLSTILACGALRTQVEALQFPLKMEEVQDDGQK